ncbi:MAG: hypothetical protein U0872_09860 [Planctomycetaceae bacterium]
MAASASNKPVGLQITLVFLVIITLILAITTYMFHSSYSTAMNDLTAANQQLGNVKKELGNSQSNETTLKRVIGLDMTTVQNAGDQNDPTTVAGAASLKMKETDAHSGADLIKTVDNLLQALNASDADRAQVAKKLGDLDANYLDLETRYRTTSEEHLKKWQKSEADLRDVTLKRDEQLAAKDQELRDLQTRKRELEDEVQNLQEQKLKEQKLNADRLARLEGINNRLQEELDKLKHVTFERADGQIVRVDFTTKKVYLNLGSADHLRERVTFSVYPKENSSIGGAPEDVKGKIEVVQILDAHNSVASIIDEDIYRPLAKGDQIYSPLWNAGRQDMFSFIGLIDLDGDGRDTRYLLHDIVKTAGAAIDNEVDNDGNRIPEDGRITERTKFLVVGDIPDPTKAVRKEDRPAMEKIHEKFKDMQGEARLNGVRVISLNDFLQYIGYKPGHRLYQPGQKHAYTLDQAVKEQSSNRTSEGNYSGVFKKDKNTKQNIAPGNNSKLFGPKSGY